MVIIRNIKVVLSITVIIFLAAATVYCAILKHKNEKLSADLESATQKAHYLMRELRLNYQALEMRESEARRLSEEKTVLIEEMENYYEADRQAGAWADAPCPAGVIERLRRKE